jgi:hypothetical protein
MHKIGDAVAVAVRFSRPVTVNGSPRLPIVLGGQSRFASAAPSQAPSDTVVFSYVVQAGDPAATGVTVNGPIAYPAGARIGEEGLAAMSTFAAKWLGGLQVDASRPTVAVSSGKTALKAGEKAVVTFALSEATADFSADDVTASGGTISSLVAAGTNGRTYTATFTPSAGFEGTATVAVAAGTFNDAAGNGNAASPALGFTVDARLPAVAITSSIASVGPGQTATITFTLSESVADFTASDISVTNGTLSWFAAVPDSSGRVFSAIFTPTPGFIGSGSVSVAAGRFVDQAGNPNAVNAITPSLVITAIRPTVPSPQIGRS